uniref:Uncharacterized protein n=1 Tax=Opuntia streptacantha TaxID=393608 RepID=A0A7C9F4W3_OPUST
MIMCGFWPGCEPGTLNHAGITKHISIGSSFCNSLCNLAIKLWKAIGEKFFNIHCFGPHFLRIQAFHLDAIQFNSLSKKPGNDQSLSCNIHATQVITRIWFSVTKAFSSFDNLAKRLSIFYLTHDIPQCTTQAAYYTTNSVPR